MKPHSSADWYTVLLHCHSGIALADRCGSAGQLSYGIFFGLAQVGVLV